MIARTTLQRRAGRSGSRDLAGIIRRSMGGQIVEGRVGAQLVVQKFGGSSVGDAERIRRVAQRIARARASEGGDDTVLTGTLADQAALNGVLAEIEALGLELLEVRRLPPR